MTVDVKHYVAEDLPEIRQQILDTHVEVRHRDFGLTGPFYDVERFDERLSAYASRPGWTAVLGYENGETVGFCFGTTLAPDTKWWNNMLTPLPAGVTVENGKRTVALNEIVVRKQWRGRSVAWQLHEAWLSHRAEERVTLLVNPANGDGAVQAVYEAWGYRKLGDQKPFPDSPVFSVMLRSVKQED
ncbi:ribosomal protein S18 acetylase RimI-like enzyme [Streptomyces canus]|uniref:Ribosomal protein S18 acetylase RimI-like enzyme n=1 Tax=Streptomyces canus TaxID=58343 RepID=A0AAW8F5U1_9ACTN|nr:GNAT family N-acetyltransferase [Streptomyces canus]MDQ0904475.1 ribosomal protein S18 acetylase RimI-like enzyme [Streptomyces canus]